MGIQDQERGDTNKLNKHNWGAIGRRAINVETRHAMDVVVDVRLTASYFTRIRQFNKINPK
jgi:hypothetical protein